MGVDAAEAETADTGDACPPMRPVTTERRRDAMSRLGEHLMRRLAADMRRHDTVADGGDGLDHPGQAGRRLGVADIGLDRTDRDRTRPWSDEFGKGTHLSRVADRGAGAVRLDVAEPGGIDPRPGVGAAQGRDLAGLGWARQAAGAVCGDAPAGDDGVRRDVERARDIAAGKHDDAAALAGPEAGRATVEHPHLVVRQRPVAREADEFERIEAEIDPADHRDVDRALGQPGAGVVDGEKRRRAGAIDRPGAAVKIEMIGDASGDGVGQPPGQALLIGVGKIGAQALAETTQQRRDPVRVHTAIGQHILEPLEKIGQPEADLRGPRELARQCVAYDDGGPLARQPVGAADPVDRLGRRLQRQPMGEIGHREARSRDTVARPVEGPVGDQPGEDRRDRVRGADRLGAVVGEREPLRRDRPERPPAIEHVPPQRFRRFGIRKPACHRQDSDGWSLARHRSFRPRTRGDPGQAGLNVCPTKSPIPRKAVTSVRA